MLKRTLVAVVAVMAMFTAAAATAHAFEYDYAYTIERMGVPTEAEVAAWEPAHVVTAPDGSVEVYTRSTGATAKSFESGAQAEKWASAFLGVYARATLGNGGGVFTNSAGVQIGEGPGY